MDATPPVTLKITKAIAVINKIELSKQLTRRKLARLPFEEKLRILEQLRAEKLPKQKRRGAQPAP
jgi:hypothetical protein